MDIRDILDSDQRIMAATTVQEGMLSFDFMDGFPPLRGKVDGRLDRNQIIQWCNVVRSTYRAREDRKETAQVEQAAAVSGPPSGEGAPADRSGRGSVPAPNHVSDPKEALVSKAQSALAELGRQRAELEGRIAQSRGELQRVKEHITFYTKLLRKIDAPKIRRSNRSAAAPEKVEAGVEARRPRKVAK